MKLHYFDTTEGDFGDDLNLWLWDEISPGRREAFPGYLLVGVGTRINNKLPQGVPEMALVSGVGHGSLPDADLMAAMTRERTALQEGALRHDV